MAKEDDEDRVGKAKKRKKKKKKRRVTRSLRIASLSFDFVKGVILPATRERTRDFAR